MPTRVIGHQHPAPKAVMFQWNAGNEVLFLPESARVPRPPAETRTLPPLLVDEQPMDPEHPQSPSTH